MCRLGLANDLCILPFDGFYLPEVNQCPRTEFGVRAGDWGIREWMDHVDLVLDSPEAAAEFAAGDRERHGDAMRVKVYNMFSLYLRHAQERVGPAGAEALIQAALGDRRFVQDLLFWEMLFNDLLGMPEPQRKLFIGMLEKNRPGGRQEGTAGARH
jgi:hypothetical protein